METALSKLKRMHAELALANRAINDLIGSVAAQEARDNPALGWHDGGFIENLKLPLHFFP